MKCIICLIELKPDCLNPRNQRDVNRHLNYCYDYGQFWLSDKQIFRFIMNEFILLFRFQITTIYNFYFQNRPFTMNETY